MALMKCLIISFSDLERNVVAEDEKLYLKEKGITTDEIQGMQRIIIKISGIFSMYM